MRRNLTVLALLLACFPGASPFPGAGSQRRAHHQPDFQSDALDVEGWATRFISESREAFHARTTMW